MLNITVCILSLNRKEYLAEAIESVCKQSVTADRIVILDNGSSPELEEFIVKEYKDKVIFRSSKNTFSFVWNWNRAMEYADSKSVYVMHDDDRLLPNFLKQQIKVLDDYDNILAIACNGYRINEKGKRLGHTLHYSNRRASIEIFNKSEDFIRLYISGSYIAFPTVVYRMPYPALIPLYPVEKVGQCGDVMFLSDLCLKGPIAYNNEILFEYRMHHRQDSNFIRKESIDALDNYYLNISKDNKKLYNDVIKYIKYRKLRNAKGMLKKKLLDIYLKFK